MVKGGEETLAKARAALAGAGVAFEESSAAGLNEKVLEILHGGRKQ